MNRDWFGFDSVSKLDNEILNLSGKVQNLENQFNNICTFAAIIIIIRFVRRIILKYLESSN